MKKGNATTPGTLAAYLLFCYKASERQALPADSCVFACVCACVCAHVCVCTCVCVCVFSEGLSPVGPSQHQMLGWHLAVLGPPV